MAFKCGHCGQKHDRVEQARECSGNEPPAPFARSAEQDHLRPKQQEYLGDLLGQFYLTLTGDLTPATISYNDGNKILQALISARRNKTMSKPFTFPDGVQMMPKGKSGERTPKGPALPDVPSGHYAVPSLTGNNDLDFFRVDRPEEGQWAGRTFVKRVIGGRPYSSVRGKTAREALEAILEFGIDEAGILYGSTLGQCSECNRHLTDELSRALGIGPECRTKPKYASRMA